MTETIVLTTEESDALEQCHDILRERYEELGELYAILKMAEEEK